MSSSAAKKDDDQFADAVELSLSTDREQGLSQNFEDPVLEDLIPGLVESPCIVQEAAEAVQELVNEAQLEPILSDLPADSVEDPVQMLVMDSNAIEDNAHASAAMSEKLFQLVVSDRSFDALVETALSAIMHSLGAQAGAVLELDVEKQEYFFRCSIGGGDPEKVKNFRVPLNKGIVGHVGESRQPTLLRDLEADQMQMRAISMSVGFDANTCMAAPILVAGQLFGVIEFFNRKDGGFFEQRDLQLLEDGTRMFAKVLEVRFLMAELMRRAQK